VDIRKSHSEANPGRLYFRCSKCEFFAWHDNLCANVSQAMRKAKEMLRVMELDVEHFRRYYESLVKENEELRAALHDDKKTISDLALTIGKLAISK
jgi:hypothetical protein